MFNVHTVTFIYIRILPNVTLQQSILGGCPFHGRVERDEIPTRESPPKQSGTR